MQRALGLLLGFTLMGASACGAELDAAGVLEAAETEPTLIVQEELSSNALTRAEASTALTLIDNICGDTWCEGDHNFRFLRLHCQDPCGRSPGTCRLTLQIFPYDSTPEAGPTFTRSCKTPDFTGFGSLVQTAPSGYQSLQPEYFDALTECISRLESNLPSH